MKEKKLSLIMALLIFFCMPLYINASIPAEINDSGVRIRSGAGTNTSIIATVNSGTAISLVNTTLHTGTGCSAGWYNITYNNQNAYVCSSYVTIIDNTFANTGINVVDWSARVNSNNVTVRKGASTNYASQATLSLGVNVNILETINASNSGCSSNKWYKISYYDNKVGYMCSKYVTRKTEITASDAEYAQAMSTAGFPDSYIPFLTFMHNNHPNWRFIAKNTNSNFATAVDAEEGKNYMQTTNNYYRISSVPAEGSSWFKVNSGVIAFYMDPRNWLTEGRVFMFEKLDYEQSFDTQYPQLIKSIFGTGSLGADTYTIPMYNYSKQYGISPLHVASRIRLEVGPNGGMATSGGAFTYQGVTYSGYYNFFNIGAYEQNGYSAVVMGLVRAMQNGWNTIDKAIKGGVAFLANGYITQGQGTLYYQKFNVRPKATYASYTHQYMTNIQAPATEGNSTYASYKSAGILNSSIIFEIPVYRNMPAYTSLPDAGDNNNNLQSLSVDGYTLSPAFDKDVLTYEVTVDENTTSVNISATAESSKATVTGTGTVTIDSDTTLVTITVTPQVSIDKKYTITIIRTTNNDDNGNDTGDNGESGNTGNTGESGNTGDNGSTGDNNNTDPVVVTDFNTILSSSNITISDNNITSIKYNTKASTIISNLTSHGAVSVVIKDANNKVVANSSLIGTGFIISITNEEETKNYTVIIKGDTSGDGKITILDLLEVQKHIKKSSTLSGVYSKAADTSKDGKITILDLLEIQQHIKGIKLI